MGYTTRPTSQATCGRGFRHRPVLGERSSCHQLDRDRRLGRAEALRETHRSTNLVLPEAASNSDATAPLGHAPSARNSTTTSRQPGSSTAPRRQNATTKPRRSPSPPRARRAATRNKHWKATTRTRGHAASPRSKLPVETRATVERNVLALVVQSPAGKLPPTLIDRQTGLAKNNLPAVCRRTRNSRSFRCIVESAVKPQTPGFTSPTGPRATAAGASCGPATEAPRVAPSGVRARRRPSRPVRRPA
jgi:hypothetical protein